MTFRLAPTTFFGRLFGALTLSAFVMVSAPACDSGKSDDKEESSDDDDKKDKKDKKGKKGKKKKKGDDGDDDSPASNVKVKFEEVRGMVKKGVPITAKQYKKLVLAHANCEVSDKNGIDSKCEAVKIMRESMNRSQLAKGALGGNSGLGKELIGHSSPAVRIKAAQMMSSFLGTGKDSQKVIVKAAAKEKNLAVIKAMIRTVRNDGARNPDVGKMLLGYADHESAMIRKEAVYGLSSSWNKKLEGGADKLIKMMESDKDMDVRKAACEYAGGLGDAKLFPVYKKLLADRSDGKLWGECFEGLVSMWGDYPLYGTNNEDAYKLTIELLNSKPRTNDIPPWTAMSNLGYLGKDDNKKLVEWKEANKWFEAGALKSALSSIVLDGDANWMSRTGAVKALKQLGAGKSDFEAMKKSIGADAKGNDSHVVKELDKAISGKK